MTQAIENSSADVTGTGGIARSAVIVIGGFALAIVIGIVKAGVISRLFGTSDAAGAFAAANTIPELLYSILSGGALAFAFVPIYSEALSHGEMKRANQLLSHVFNAVLLLTSVSSVVIMIFAPYLVSVPWGVAPDFTPEVQALTSDMIRVLLLSTNIFAVSSIFTGALHAHQHFLLPALAPSARNIGIIIGALLLKPSMGPHSLVWGAVLGSAFHLLIQVPGLLRHRIRWSPLLSFNDPQLIRVAILMAPRIADLFMARVSLEWLRNNLVSGMGADRVAALGLSYTLMDMPWTLIGTALSTAVFPTMAILAAKNDIDAQRRALSGTLRAVLTLAIPAAVGLIVLGRPIIQVLYEGGEFTAESTELVYHALRFYALTMISLSMLDVVVRAFAAQKDTLTPLIVSFFTTTLNFILAFWLTRPAEVGGLEHAGPALATAIAVGVESTTGILILRHRWGGIDGRQILMHTGKAVIASAVMAATIAGIRVFLPPSPLILLIAGGGAGILTYFAVGLLLGIKEIRTIPMALIQRFVQFRTAPQAQS